MADHIIRHANINLFPFDGQAVRAVSAVLVPAAVALLDDAEEAEDRLHYAIEFLSTVSSPRGDAEGGWAEGPHDGMTGMAYLIDAANLIRGHTGIDLSARPFFRKTGDFPLYTKAPDTRRATFCDDSTMGDLPAVKIGFNLRQFAGVTCNGACQWDDDEIRRTNPDTEMAFYNGGWRDFNFDELVYRTDFPTVDATPPDDGLRRFEGTGWVTIQTATADPDRHIQFGMKSLPYGSISHGHGDRNAFCLAGPGEDPAIQSGYHVAINSTMHQNWRRQTRFGNAILLDGKGQYAGRDKARAMQSAGRIEGTGDRHDHGFIRGDTTLTPEVRRVARDVYFVDAIDAETPVAPTWLLHPNAPLSPGGTTFRYSGERAGFYGQFVRSEAGPPAPTQETGFADVDASEIEGLPVSTCPHATFLKATRHCIATLLVPYPLSSPRRIFSFLDDQGYDCELSFTDAADRSFRTVIPKSFGVDGGALHRRHVKTRTRQGASGQVGHHHRRRSRHRAGLRGRDQLPLKPRGPKLRSGRSPARGAGPLP